MAKPLPEGIWRTASEHAASHRIELTEALLGRPNASRKRVPFTWHQDDELGPYVRCRLCPEGFDRFYADVHAPDPTERSLSLIRAHFLELHELEIDPSEIYSESVKPSERKATWLPAIPTRGAMIICTLCPEGLNRRSVGERPYGDARRLRDQLRNSPHLYEETRGMTSLEQAQFLEARDRGLPQQKAAADARRALSQARRQPRPPDELEALVQKMLRQAGDAGNAITSVIEGLDALSRTDEDKYARLLALAIPDLALAAQRMPPAQLAEAVKGRFPQRQGNLKVRERRLWELWVEVR